LVVLAAVIVGIIAGETLGPAAAQSALLAGIVGVAGARLIRSRTVSVLVAMVAFALLGTAAMQRALHGLAVSPLAAMVTTRADGIIAATLVEDPNGARFDARVLVRVDRAAGSDAGGRRVLVSATGDVAARVRLLSAGDTARLRGWFEPLTGFDGRWQWRHAVGAFHATALEAVARSRSPLTRAANAARATVLAGSERLAPVDRALLAGFLLGDTRGVPPAVTERFRAAGLTHLTAVSGENVAFVLALFAPFLRRCSLRGRLLGGVAVLIFFGTMTRWEPSVLRAIVMAVIALVAGYFGRPTTGLRVLALAAIVLLLADPFLLHSVGFLLSCAASLGIAVLARPITARLRGPVWMREVLGVTSAAQFGVAPVLIPVFGSMPVMALPANLVAVPIAAPLTMWGLGAGVVGGVVRPYAPQVPRVLGVPSTAMIHALIAIADVAARVPIAIDGRRAWALIALVCLAAATRRARRLRR
ncbi:MAG TPA: ComEC/Rec2 family competence protein, partial [Acidimicrobiia bacterium]